MCSCLEEAVVSSLEEAGDEAGFSALEELPVLSEVPFEEEEAGFSSLDEAGFSSLEEADISSLEEASELLELVDELDGAPLTVNSSLLLVTVQSL